MHHLLPAAAFGKLLLHLLVCSLRVLDRLHPRVRIVAAHRPQLVHPFLHCTNFKHERQGAVIRRRSAARSPQATGTLMTHRRWCPQAGCAQTLASATALRTVQLIFYFVRTRRHIFFVCIILRRGGSSCKTSRDPGPTALFRRPLVRRLADEIRFAARFQRERFATRLPAHGPGIGPHVDDPVE